MDYKEITLDTLNMGAARELFDAAWKRLLDNIADENTKATAVRSISITIKVKPSETRETANTTVGVKESLAPLNPHEHFVYFSTDGRNLHAYTTDPKAPMLDFEGDNVSQFPAIAGGR